MNKKFISLTINLLRIKTTAQTIVRENKQLILVLNHPIIKKITTWSTDACRYSFEKLGLKK